MKNRLLCYLPAAVLAVAASGSAFGHSGTNSCSGIREDLQQGIVLTATTNAPAGASGKANIIAVNDNGTNSSVLFVKTTGLTNGIYYVSLTDVTGTNTYDLGSLNVSTPTNIFCGRGPRKNHGHGFGFGFGDGFGRNGVNFTNLESEWTNWVAGCSFTNSSLTNFLCGHDATNYFGTNVYHWYTNTLSAGSGSFVLPTDLAQSNVANIYIYDQNEAVDLTGDFTGVTNSSSIYIETVNLVPGTATNLVGDATLTITTVNGKERGSFKLTGSGLDPIEKLYITANDTNTFRAYTSRTGTLKLNNLRRTKIVDLQSLVATDVSSNVVFSANF